MNKTKKTVHLLVKGCPYALKAYDCYTLKQAMEQGGLKRSDVLDWWKE